MITRPAERIGCLIVLLGLATRPATGQTILLPGEARENVPAVGRVLEIQARFDGGRSWAEVRFDRADAEAQNMRLEASHPSQVRYIPEFGTAIAQGMLFADFCVPAAGAVSGCGAEPADPDIVSATLAFGYGVVGHLSAFGFTSKATLEVTASVLDVAAQEYVQIRELEKMSVQSKSVTIAKVPIPIPGLRDAAVTRPETFALVLKRGRVYRFQLAAKATSTRGLAQSPGSVFYAYSDFSPPVEGLDSPPDGFVQLRNLTISVPPDGSSLLTDIVKSFQEQINKLVDQIDRLRSEYEDNVAALRQQLAELRLATLGAGLDVCSSISPGPDWVCMNGGWLPPGHPSANVGVGFPVPPSPSAPAPPPPACLTAPPATGWVCINGGWVPPGHPLASGGG
jgi:hypothetical protein